MECHKKGNEKGNIQRMKKVFFTFVEKYNKKSFNYFDVHFQGRFSFSTKDGKVVEVMSSSPDFDLSEKVEGWLFF